MGWRQRGGKGGRCCQCCVKRRGGRRKRKPPTVFSSSLLILPLIAREEGGEERGEGWLKNYSTHEAAASLSIPGSVIKNPFFCLPGWQNLEVNNTSFAAVLILG